MQHNCIQPRGAVVHMAALYKLMGEHRYLQIVVYPVMKTMGEVFQYQRSGSAFRWRDVASLCFV